MLHLSTQTERGGGGGGGGQTSPVGIHPPNELRGPPT